LSQILCDALPPEVSEMRLDKNLLIAIAELPVDVLRTALQAAAVGFLQASDSYLIIPLTWGIMSTAQQ
jgi:hypothetical protein